jgi:hypothetical protein
MPLLWPHIPVPVNSADIKPQANPLSTDPNAIASNIKYHDVFTPSFSPYKFELQQAYAATAESLRDAFVQRWNETYKHFTKENAKTIHYLSMEFLQVRVSFPIICLESPAFDFKANLVLLCHYLIFRNVWFVQGRALLNAVGNLELKDA